MRTILFVTLIATKTIKRKWQKLFVTVSCLLVCCYNSVISDTLRGAHNTSRPSAQVLKCSVNSDKHTHMHTHLTTQAHIHTRILSILFSFSRFLSPVLWAKQIYWYCHTLKCHRFKWIDEWCVIFSYIQTFICAQISVIYATTYIHT